MYTTVETIMYSETKFKADIVIAHSHNTRQRNDFYNAAPSQPSPFQATLDSHLKKYFKTARTNMHSQQNKVHSLNFSLNINETIVYAKLFITKDS